MKIIRVFVGIAAGILLCFGIMLYSSHKAVENIAYEVMVDGVVEQVSEVILQPGIIEDVIGSLPEEVQDAIPNQEDLPQEVQEKIEDVKTSIMEDEQIKELSKTYMDALLGSVVNNGSSLPDVNTDIKNVIEAHAQEIAEVGGKEVSREQIAILTDKITEKIDLQPKLEHAINQVNGVISPDQKQMLASLQMMQSSSMNLTSIIVMVGAIVIIALSSKSFYKWLLYAGLCGIMSGVVLVLTSKVVDMFVGGKIGGLGATFISIKDSILTSLSSSGIEFLVFGGALLVIYAIVITVKKYVVYE